MARATALVVRSLNAHLALFQKLSGTRYSSSCKELKRSFKNERRSLKKAELTTTHVVCKEAKTLLTLILKVMNLPQLNAKVSGTLAALANKRAALVTALVQEVKKATYSLSESNALSFGSFMRIRYRRQIQK